MSEIERLQRRLERERIARRSVEDIAEKKTRELYESNQELSQLSDNLQKRSAELQQTLGYLTAIIDNMADSLLVVDTENRVKLVNQSFIEMFGLKGRTLIDQDCGAVFDKSLLSLIDKSQTSYFDDNIRLDIEMTENRTGRAIANSIFSGAAAAGETPSKIGVVIIIRDFTKEKEIDRVKTEFISNVSHELRTPLTSILGFTKIIKRKFEKTLLPSIGSERAPKISKAIDQVTGNIDIIISEGERLTNLINGVLDVAKMEAGKIDWNVAPVSMASAINRAAAATQGLFENANVRLEIEIEDGLPDVDADQDRIIQVLVNLISNASKFTDRGSVTCKVENAGAEIVTSVIDTGVGIAQEDLAKVFEKFKQVGDTLTDKPKGTGLGLPICKQIIEYHGGRIWVESSMGEGSVFSFSLPIRAVDESPESPERKVDINALVGQLSGQVENDSTSENNGVKTVLIVDDEPNIREYLRQELEGAGYRVAEAENGLEAISKTKQMMPDLVILDVMMPMMNGFDAAAVLKNDPQTMKIPIVILSIIEDRERGYLIGVNRYLKKPVEADVLLNEVDNLVARQGVKKKILLVGQEPEVIESLHNALELAGDTIVEICNGQNCIDMARLTQPDTIIFDTSIPGYQQVEKSLRTEKGFENVSFILLGEDQDLNSLALPQE